VNERGMKEEGKGFSSSVKGTLLDLVPRHPQFLNAHTRVHTCIFKVPFGVDEAFHDK
jgi:hypothetical protein